MKKILVGIFLLIFGLCLVGCVHSTYEYQFHFYVDGGKGTISVETSPSFNPNVELCKDAEDLCTLDCTEESYFVTLFGGEKGSREITFNATPNTGYQVKEWVFNGEIVEGNKTNSYTAIVTSEENYIGVIVVRFEEIKQQSLDELALSILNSMTLEQKLGQMFMVSPDWTSYNDAMNSIRDYHFGNIIYMTPSVSNKTKIASLSNSLQKQMMDYNGIAGFISIDQEGGRVNRLSDGGTRFVSSMSIAATNNSENAYSVGKAVGYELKNYGINSDLTPVLDVNKNPDNPSIGIRSYGDNPEKVAKFATQMFLGLKSQNVLSCAKHFPGYGDTNLDSHETLPIVNTSKDDLEKSELLPYVSAINNGIDAIMTGHIIYTALDKNYPATLSKVILQDLLRKELGFEGLIISDSIEMNAIKNYYGSFDKTSVMAVNAGVDILLYTGMGNAKSAYTGLQKAVNNKQISIARINESVLRIIKMKLKYNVNDYLAPNKNIASELKEHSDLNQRIADNALTLVKGEYKISKEEKVLIVSSKTSYNPGYSSFSEYAKKCMDKDGYKITSYNVSDNVTQEEYDHIMNMISEFDKVIIAMSNVKKFNYTNSVNLVNDLSNILENNLLVIGLFSPYDILAYDNVSNYICVYCDQLESHNSIIKYLESKLIPTGVAPINLNK